MSRRWIGVVERLLWYAVAAYAVLAYAEARVLPLLDGSIDAAVGVGLARAASMLVVIFAAFALVDVVVRRAIVVLRERQVTDELRVRNLAFPDGATVVVGVWLGLFAIASIAGLLVSLVIETPSEDMTGALVAMAAAGIGSAVATIVGYLKHASEQQDFDLAYVPWYGARPLMGLLLGLIFFLLLKAGLLATFPEMSTEDPSVNEWGVAGIGALVGLFSKPAIDKLREVFNVLFRTETERDEDLLERLPPEERERIRPFLKGSPRPQSP